MAVAESWAVNDWTAASRNANMAVTADVCRQKRQTAAGEHVNMRSPVPRVLYSAVSGGGSGFEGVLMLYLVFCAGIASNVNTDDVAPLCSAQQGSSPASSLDYSEVFGQTQETVILRKTAGTRSRTS